MSLNFFGILYGVFWWRDLKEKGTVNVWFNFWFYFQLIFFFINDYKILINFFFYVQNLVKKMVETQKKKIHNRKNKNNPKFLNCFFIQAHFLNCC